MDDKNTFKQNIQAQIDGYAAKLDALTARLSEAATHSSAEIEQQVQVLRGKLKEARGKLGHVVETGPDAWADVKQGFEKAWQELKVAFEKANKRL